MFFFFSFTWQSRETEQNVLGFLMIDLPHTISTTMVLKEWLYLTVTNRNMFAQSDPKYRDR